MLDAPLSMVAIQVLADLGLVDVSRSYLYGLPREPLASPWRLKGADTEAWKS